MGTGPAPTGAAQFLGSDAALLKPGAEGQAAYLYINPNVQWGQLQKGHAEAGGVLGHSRHFRFSG